jgi:hypothetical protein
MAIRKGRALIAILSVLMLASGTLAGVFAGTTPAASAQVLKLGAYTVREVPAGAARHAQDGRDLPLVTICLTESSSYCVDVKSNDNKSTEPVWVWDNGADDQWYVWGEGCVGDQCDSACPEGVSSCYEFEDAENPSLCWAIGPNEEGQLLGCETAYGGTGEATFYQIGDHFKNVGWLLDGDEVTVQGPLYNGDIITVAPYGESGDWYQWSFS